MQKYFFIICLSLSSFHAQALVDMKNANFTDYWVDFILADNSELLKVSRIYSSRSLFSGIFGFGWCSNIESKIEISLEGNLLLSECGTGNVLFYPANSNPAFIQSSVEKLMAQIKKANPAKDKQFFDSLRTQLINDAKLRSKYAGDVGFKFNPTKNTTYQPNGTESDKIVFDGSFYVRTTLEGWVQRFDSTGKLVQLQDKQKNTLKLTYSSGLLVQLADQVGHKVSLTYTPEKKLKQLNSGNSIVTYKFNGENLTGVTNAWQNSYSYSYDSNHNLTKIDFPDGTSKTLSYNEIKDWVREFRDRDGCIETYEFTLSTDNPKDHYWSTAVKNCKGKTLYKHRYEFWYQTRPDKEKYLSRVLSEKNSQIIDISYHQDFGKPIAIRKNADVTTYQYLNNGYLKQKAVSYFIPQSDETFKYSMSFDYDKEWHIESTATDYFNKSGKLLKRKKTVFKYDSVNRLVLAKNSDGQFVEIKYNPLGLISSISDQTKKEVTIEYDPKTQKPTAIARPDVGSLQLTYAASGEIKKINNKGGSTTTSQIYSTFNNFIDIVGPVSTELSLSL